jgi:hypothetical protein
MVRVLVEFTKHYNAVRPHRGIDLDAPIPYESCKSFDASASVCSVDRLGGHVHRYSVAT